MKEDMRIMTKVLLNAETHPRFLRSWITANSVFFNHNQGEIRRRPGETPGPSEVSEHAVTVHIT